MNRRFHMGRLGVGEQVSMPWITRLKVSHWFGVSLVSAWLLVKVIGWLPAWEVLSSHVSIVSLLTEFASRALFIVSRRNNLFCKTARRKFFVNAA